MATVEELAGRIVKQSRAAERYVVAVAGPPGAGKSTLSQALARHVPASAVLEADGFHYDNMLLDALGLRARKGASNTFDCRGLDLTLSRIRACEDDVVVPVFDRGIDVSRGAARMIGRDVRHVIVEGNYLAVDRPPWSALRRHFDFVVYIDVARETLERRLIERWTDLRLPDAIVRQKVEDNDLPNVDFVQSATGACDVVWRPDFAGNSG